LNYINIQGLTKQKMAEIEMLMDQDQNNKIFILAETHLKSDRIHVSDNKDKIIEMREVSELRGGGLMAIYKRDEDLMVNQITSENSDILKFEIKISNNTFKVLAVYFAVRTSPQSTERNRRLLRELETEVENSNLPVLIIGDFNGHINEIGHQREDENGRIVKKLINEQCFVLLNIDDKCIGKITWQRGESISTIDYALANVDMYSMIHNMEIDEEGEKLDISDHKLITVKLNIENQNKKAKWKWIERNYLSTNPNHLELFRESVDRKLDIVKPCNMTDVGNLIQSTANETLVRTYRKRVNYGKEETQMEKPWFTEEIRNEIKYRKNLNREKRNEKDPTAALEKKLKYDEQKEKVQKIVKEEIRKYEEKIAKEIKEDKSRKQVWKCIHKLQGKEIKREELKLYDDSGVILNPEKERETLKSVWSSIYKKSENTVTKAWNRDIKGEYERRNNEEDPNTLEGRNVVLRLDNDYKIVREETVISMNRETREHLDMAFKLEITPKPMRKIEVKQDDVIKQLKKLKTGKSPGPDGLKVELYKELSKSQKFMSNMVESINRQLEEETIPNDWKKSKTVMLKKKKKPTARDLRPIALTNIDYKIFMSILKEEIEKHIMRIGMEKENQAGFSRGRRIEDNLFILRYCVEESLKMKSKLYVAAIDFSKAFDSVNREKMIEVLKKYKIESRIIQQISRVYDGDSTEVYLRDGMHERIDIHSGIRQGCTVSALLFKLVTYEIMDEVDECVRGFSNETIKLTSLFFADDALLLASTEGELKRSLRIMIEKSKYYGLELNKQKSNIVIFNEQLEEKEEIDGIKVVKEIKYLGVSITNSRKIFDTHKKYMTEKALKLSNVTAVVVERSVCRLMIGKTYWKCVALPSFMSATGVMSWKQKEIDELQVIENGALRKILCGRSYTPICALRGEVGSSLMETRIIKNRLKYDHYLRHGGNKMLEIIREDMENKKHSWIRETKKYGEKVEIGKDRRCNEKMIDHIDRKCREYDTSEWRKEVETKTSLYIYKEWKRNVGEVAYCEGNYESRLWLEARTNTLTLRDRKRFVGESVECIICGYEREDLMHFILDCPSLMEERQKIVELQRPHEEDARRIVGRFLFEEHDVERKMKGLKKMYCLRNEKESTANV